MPREDENSSPGSPAGFRPGSDRFERSLREATRRHAGEPVAVYSTAEVGPNPGRFEPDLRNTEQVYACALNANGSSANFYAAKMKMGGKSPRESRLPKHFKRSELRSKNTPKGSFDVDIKQFQTNALNHKQKRAGESAMELKAAG